MEYQTSDMAILGGLLMVVVSLVRVVERLVDNLLSRRNGVKKSSSAPPPPGKPCGLTTQEHAALIRLDELHAKTDEDGTPLWYVPRSLGRTLEETCKNLDKVAVRLRDVVKTQEIMNRRMDRWEQSTVPHARTGGSQ